MTLIDIVHIGRPFLSVSDSLWPVLDLVVVYWHFLLLWNHFNFMGLAGLALMDMIMIIWIWWFQFIHNINIKWIYVLLGSFLFFTWIALPKKNAWNEISSWCNCQSVLCSQLATQHRECDLYPILTCLSFQSWQWSDITGWL